MRCRQIGRSLIVSLAIAFGAMLYAQTSTRIVGAISAISGHTLTIKPDTGAPSTVTVGDTARILRMQPGAKKLSDATAITFGDLAVGDRVLALVKADVATTIVAMKKADIAQKQQADAADWTTRGAAGLVKAVDAAANTITIASGPRTLTIHTTPSTIVRRYSTNSAQFADAKPSTLAEIHPGDQLRVRGNRNADRSEIAADEIVSGSFRNIAGPVLSTNPGENTVTVRDMIGKKQVVIHVAPDSQMHKLPSQMAETLAARLKHSGSAGGKGGQHRAAVQQSASSSETSANSSGEGRGGDLSQMLERTPTMSLSDLHKGDELIIVATEGTADSATAITVLAGVEPILSAFPSGSQSVFSASWNLNGGGAGAGAGGGGGGGGGGSGGGGGTP